MTFEEHADVILAVFGLAHHSLALSEYAAILVAVRTVYEDGRQSMAKDIGPYMRVDPAAIMPQSGGISSDGKCWIGVKP